MVFAERVKTDVSHRNELATFVVSGGNGTGVHENVDGVNTDARIQVGKKLGNPLGGVRKPLAL